MLLLIAQYVADLSEVEALTIFKHCAAYSNVLENSSKTSSSTTDDQVSERYFIYLCYHLFMCITI